MATFKYGVQELPRGGMAARVGAHQDGRVKDDSQMTGL